MSKRQIVSSNGKDVGRQVPQDVKTSVWQRDGGRCRQCGAQQYLEFDHIIPYWHQDYPRIQILTIEALLHVVEVKMPPQFGTFNQALRVQQSNTQKYESGLG